MMENKEFVIYGINRVAKDFLYIFDSLNVLFFVDDETHLKEFQGKPILPTSILREKKYDVIICDFEHEEKIKLLENYGYEENENYWVEESFFSQLGEYVLPRDKKIMVWGTGGKAEVFLKYYKGRIDGFIDNNKQEENFHNYNVFLPEEVTDIRECFIIIAVRKDRDIQQQLMRMGISKDAYVNYQEILNKPANLLKQTIFSKDMYDLECNTMHNHLEVFENDTRCCCSTFSEISLGAVRKQTIDEIWNSNVHKILSLSTENRTYSFCNKSMCPFFIERERLSLEDIKLDVDYKTYDKAPSTILLAFDNTCNLKCESCRKDVFIAKGEQKKESDQIAEIVKEQLLDKCDFMIAAGHGEVFLSDSYKSVYMDERCNNIKNIRLLSNGTLFNEANWKEFKNSKLGKVMLTVSIDAATPETYKKIRCGGNFQQLKKNMEFASYLRKIGELSYFRLNFVVQRSNFEEMPLFVEWGKQLDVDEIFFTKILNWGTYTREEFRDVSMMEEDGITPKKELLTILDLPIMKDPIVDYGTIQCAHKKIEEKVVDNYYRWELERKVPGLFV